MTQTPPLVSALIDIQALQVAPSDEVFWYTSGTVGPYYINTHYLYGGQQPAQELLEFIDEINAVLGIFYELEEEAQQPDELPPHLAELLHDRDDARRRKDWSRSDELRDKLESAGIELRDAPAGTTWSWKSAAKVEAEA